MKKTTYTKKSNTDKNKKIDKKKKDIEKLKNEELELTNIYKYKGKDRTKAKLKNNARVAKYEANQLKLKYKSGGLGQKVLIILMLFLIFCLTIGIIFTLYVLISSPKFDTSNLYSKESIVLLDKNGNEYARLGTENRELVTYDDLPQNLIDAIIATEDSRFFQHNGVDLARFTKAVAGQLLGRSDAGGGSTLTMQVVKNAYTSTESSGIGGIIRKFTDIYMSVFKVEKSYTKEQIIEFYVNIPFLGSGAFGVEQASQIYFGKSVGELSLSEAAVIAGLFQAPSAYDPYSYPEKAEQRRNIVLSLMKRHGYITDTEYEMAKKMKVEDMLVGNTKTLNKYQGFVDTVVQEVIDRTGNDPATTSMVIYTTLDTERQDVIEGIYNGDTYTWKNDIVQAAMAVIDVNDGSIAAIGAGRNKKTERSLNYATWINRHPGSTAKPIFDYGPAIQYLNWSTGQTIIDEKYSYTGGGSIKNWDNRFKGLMTIQDALAQSRNIPAVYTFQQLSQDQIKEFVTNLGITPEYENGYINESHAIGGFNGVSPLKLAAAYATFSRGGTYIEPYSVTKIEYSNSGETFTVTPEKRKAMDDSTAYMVNSMLKYAVTSGNISTGTVSGTDVASKTGTSTVDTDKKKALGITGDMSGDAWQVTYSPDYAIALWYAYDEIDKNHYLTSAEGNSARRLISKVLGSKILKPNSKWTQPSSVVSAEVEVGTDPLELPSEGTPSDLRRTYLFKKGTVPTETSIRFAKLDNVTNLNYSATDSSVLITWKGIDTPKQLDTNWISEYFNNNIYKPWADGYINKRIEYNNSVLGGIGYAIYINGAFVGTTTQTNYTYNGAIASSMEVTVKTIYNNYSACNSDGVSIMVTPNGGTSPSTPSDNNSNNKPNNTTTESREFTFDVDTLDRATYETLKASGNLNSIVTVYSNGKNVTNQATITIDDSDVNTNNKLIITVIYYGKSQTKSITIN